MLDAMAAVSALAVGALIVLDDTVLMVRQQGPDDPAPYWSIPGGVVERGEFAYQAMVREVREETGLIVAGSGRLAWISQHDMPGLGMLTAFGFEVDGCQGDPLPADPDGLVLDAAWVPVPEAARRIATIGFGPMREPVLHHLRRRGGPPTLWSWPSGVDAKPVIM